MSNETNTQTEQVHQVTDVPQTNPVPVTVVKPKRFIKTRNNVRHPIQTIKRNKTACVALASATAGAVAVVLLNSRKDNESDEVTEVDEDETPNLTLLESYNIDTEN